MMKFNTKLTILVNSCDAYEDLWCPFFTLLKKYWQPMNVEIILNTESKDFIFDGLNIKCVHPKDPSAPYGARMLNALDFVRTEYVVMLLDDFFLREAVKADAIERIISWMDKDKKITYFNCDCTPVWCSWEEDKYPGYRRIPWGNSYTLNMQAAIWRTERLKNYWLPNVTPWDWELRTNVYAALNTKEKFYCATSLNGGFCNYGNAGNGYWSVVRGKWAIDDIEPFFKKEGIEVDYSKRGYYVPPQNSVGDNAVFYQREWTEQSDMIDRSLPDYKEKYAEFIRERIDQGKTTGSPEIEFTYYLMAPMQTKFYKKMRYRLLWGDLKRKSFGATIKTIFNKVKQKLFKE